MPNKIQEVSVEVLKCCQMMLVSILLVHLEGQRLRPEWFSKTVLEVATSASPGTCQKCTFLSVPQTHWIEGGARRGGHRQGGGSLFYPSGDSVHPLGDSDVYWRLTATGESSDSNNNDSHRRRPPALAQPRKHLSYIILLAPHNDLFYQWGKYDWERLCTLPRSHNSQRVDPRNHVCLAPSPVSAVLQGQQYYH